MFGLGMQELIVILIIVMIIFGVGKLPDIGYGIGKAIRGFKKGMSESLDNEPDIIKDKEEITSVKNKIEKGNI